MSEFRYRTRIGRGDYAGAQRYYKLDLGIARKLAEGSDDVQAMDDLAVSCYKN